MNEVLQGLISGMQMRQQMEAAQREQARLQMQQQQMEQEQAIRDIQTLMTLATTSRPVDGGMVQDTAEIPGGPGQLGAGTKVPIARKAEAGRTVKFKDRQFELLTPEEQAARERSMKVADAEAMLPLDRKRQVNHSLGVAEGEQAAREKFGQAPTEDMQSILGMPGGVNLMPREVIAAAQTIANFQRAVKIQDLKNQSSQQILSQKQRFESGEKDKDRQSRERVAGMNAQSRITAAGMRGQSQGSADAQGRFLQKEYDSVTTKLDAEAAKEQTFHRQKLEAGENGLLSEGQRAMKLKALDGQIAESQRRQTELRKQQQKFASKLGGGSASGASSGRVVSTQQIQAFAKKMGISEEAARAQAKAEGYEVQ